MEDIQKEYLFRQKCHKGEGLNLEADFLLSV